MSNSEQPPKDPCIHGAPHDERCDRCWWDELNRGRTSNPFKETLCPDCGKPMQAKGPGRYCVDIDCIEGKTANVLPTSNECAECARLRSQLHALLIGLEVPAGFWEAQPPASLLALAAAVAKQAKRATSGDSA